MNTTTSAANILRLAIRIGQADLLSEALQDSPNENEITLRIRKAITTGFLANIDGEFSLTAKGTEYLAKVA